MKTGIRTGSFRFLVTILFVVGIGAEQAIADSKPIHLPPQSLWRSLNDVARETHTNILFAPDTVGALHAPAVDGAMTALDAVKQLLSGTGLEVISDRGGLIVRVKVLNNAPLTDTTTYRAWSSNTVGEFVIVTGIRESLQKNLDLKRDSLGLVDVITSETIGKFPESNLAAAMMRVPGVNVNRRIVGMVGIDSTMGDPTEVTVRGFGPTFNVVLIDGRSLGSSTGTRSYDFNLLASDMVEEVDIQKSPDASLAPGAIGATINIKTPKPFDHMGLRIAASASTTYSPEEGKFTPNGMVLFSDTFAHDRVGLLLAGAYNETRSRSNEATIWAWDGTYLDPCQLRGGPECGTQLKPDTSKPVWAIQDYGTYQIHNWAMRENGRVALQWIPVGSLLLTLNANFARNDLKERQYSTAIWNSATEMRDVVTSDNGTVVDFVRENTPTDFTSQSNETVKQSYDIGLNARWEVSSHWSIEEDGDVSLSSMNPGQRQGNYGADVGYGPSCASNCLMAPINGIPMGIVVSPNGGHTLPYYTSYGPNGDTANFLNPTIIGSHVMVIVKPRNRDSVIQTHLEATWENAGFRLSFGVQRLANHVRLKNYDDLSNNGWQAYAGYGPDSNNYYVSGPNAGKPAGVHLPSALFKTSFNTANFISGWSGSKLPAQILVFDVFAVYKYLEGLGNPTGPTSIPGFNWGCCGGSFDGTFQVSDDPASNQSIFEDNYASYFSVTGDAEVAGLPLTYRGGLRLEHTNLHSEGLVRQPISMSAMASDHTAFFISYGPLEPVAADHNYQYFLPNLDLIVRPYADVQLRLNASRSLARPSLTSLSPALSLSSSERVGVLVATGQNPNLMPYLSNNLDLTVEWYNTLNSYVSVDTFFKNMTNFVIATTVTQSINGVIDPTTGQPAQFNVSSYINGPSATVYGVELAWQQMLGDTGLGLQLNTTIVGTDRPYNPKDISTSNFAVTGLADSANVVGLYDKGGYQIRLSANWHDSYLEHFGQQLSNSAFGAEPVIVNPSWDMSLNMSCDLSRQFTVYFEALNLLGSTYSTRGRFSEQVLDVIDYGRRFTLGLHYKL